MTGSQSNEPRPSSRGVVVALVAAAVVLITCVVLIARLKKDPPTRAPAIGARLELASGTVTLKADGGFVSVISGVPLASGAVLKTAEGARALVRLSDGSSVLLRGGTTVSLEPTGLVLETGEVWLDAPPGERAGALHRLGDVTVAAADAGVSLRKTPEGAAVVVTRGLAIVSAPKGRVEVNAGEQAAIAGGTPKVTPIAFWDDWTGGMGDQKAIAGTGAGAGRIYGIDPVGAPGVPARTLEISRQSVRAVVRDGLVETEVDQTFSNPGGRQVEGWYWFSVPERAVVSSFAVETDGVLVEGEVIERQEAQKQYVAAARASRDPALLEWIDGTSFRARIFPVPASGTRRVVLRYLELATTQDGKLTYLYPMRSTDPVEIGEFSLSVDLGDAGRQMKLATLADAVVEDGGRRVGMRRSGYVPRADFQLEATLPTEGRAPVRVARFAAGSDRADYVMVRYVPDVAWSELKDAPGDLVVVVDTSASSDEAVRQQKAAAAEAVLRALSPEDHFALVALDVEPKVLFPAEGLAAADDKEIKAALERLSEHATGGATDLGSLYEVALERLHGTEQPAIVYIGDGLPTSGELDAVGLAERLRRSIEPSRARFFTVGVGPDANQPLLAELARVGGGQAFRIDSNEGATTEVLRLASAVKRPTLTELAVDLGAGLDEPLLTASGKVSRGEEVVLLARTHHALPDVVKIKGRVGGKEFAREHPVKIDTGVGATLVPRLWAAEKMRRLLGESGTTEKNRGKIVELGLEYGIATPFTSFLALESEQAYQQQGIRRRTSPVRGKRLAALDPAELRRQDDAFAALPPAVGLGCAKSEAPPSATVAPAAAKQEAASPEGYARREVARGDVAADEAPASALVVPPRTSDDKPADLERDQNRAPGEAQAGDPLSGVVELGGIGAKGRGAGGAPKPASPEPLAAATSTPAASPPPPPAVAQPARLKTAPGKDARLGLGLAKEQAQNEKKKAEADGRARSGWAKAACSDTARRPLADRLVVWRARIKDANTAGALIARYEGAKATCEVPDWRAEAALLSLLETKIRSEGGATEMLAHFAGQLETQKFLARAILRRSADPAIVAAVRRVLFEGRVNWVGLDEDLAALPGPAERIAKLRAVLATAPGDPEGEVRLVRLLAEDGQKDEALSLGRRLRDRGFLSPTVTLELGDVLARAGFQEDAVRAYSELIEFDPRDATARRLLGDVFLRQGWHDAAYRQYKTLTEFAEADPVAWLRLAAAAAGTGRVDEALRLERKVATAEGTPGPADPRLFARLHSGARLARLLQEPPADGSATPETVARKLKELQLWSGPGTYVILTWEDFDARLAIEAIEKGDPIAYGDATDASVVGLVALAVPAADGGTLPLRVRLRDDRPRRDVAFVAHVVTWDGKAFAVKLVRGKVNPKEPLADLR